MPEIRSPYAKRIGYGAIAEVNARKEAGFCRGNRNHCINLCILHLALQPTLDFLTTALLRPKKWCSVIPEP